MLSTSVVKVVRNKFAKAKELCSLRAESCYASRVTRASAESDEDFALVLKKYLNECWFCHLENRNKFICSCGVCISLSSNSRRLINTPLDNKSLHVNFLAKEIQGKGNSITRVLVTFGSKAVEKENAFAEYHLPLQNYRKLLLDFWFQHLVCRVSFPGDEPED